MKKDKIYALTSIAIFMTVLILPSLLWLCAGLLPGHQRALDYDLGENCAMASFPETFSVTYMQEVEAYYNDRLPFRSMMISANREIDAFMDETYDDVVVPHLAKLVQKNVAPATSEQASLQKTEQNAIQKKTDDQTKNSNEAVISDKVVQSDGTQETLSETAAKTQGDFAETGIREDAPDMETSSGGKTLPDEKVPSDEETSLNREGEESDGEEETLKENKESLKDNEPSPEESEKNPQETKEAPESARENPLFENENPTYLMPKIHNDSVLEGSDKWLFFMLENSLEDYQGTNIFSQAQLEEYVANMQAIQRSCDATGKSLYFLIPPNKEQVYSEKMPDITVYDNYKRQQRLVDYIHANTNLKVAYPLSEMRSAKGKHQVYFRTDTHWNYAGAFVGVQALYALMGMPTTSLSSVPTEQFYVSPSEIGDLIGVGNLSPEVYGGDVNYSVGYKADVIANVVAGGDPGSNFYSATSPSGQPCNLVVVGDSFRIYAGLFLQKDFSSCTLVKYKYSGDLNNTNAINAIKAADCIIILLAERDYVFMPGISSEIQNILNGS